VALLVFGVWLALAVPIQEEALQVRGGRSLASAWLDLLLVRVDLVAMHLPRAWIGGQLPHTLPRLVAGLGLSSLVIAAGVVAWRRGGRLRWVVVFALVCVPGMSLGHSLAAAPQVYRYYLPLLAAGIVLVAAWDLRAVAAVALLGLVLQLPSGPPEGWQAPDRSHLELGASALHRFAPDPHVKFKALSGVTAPRLRPYLAFGYGLDSGVRFSDSWGGMREGLSRPGAAVDVARDPHLYLFDARTWIEVGHDQNDPAARRSFFEGLGVGMARDGVIDDNEVALLAVMHRIERGPVIEGVGAALLVQMEGGAELDGWTEAFSLAATDDDWEALGRGIARCAGPGGVPPGVDRLVVEGSPALQRLLIGLEARRDVELRAMVEQPVVPTPEG
jgi:hypothetical protein